MAIELLSAPTASAQSMGVLTLPVTFDTKAHAAKWVKAGPAVAAAAEREYIPGTRLTADGWQVWRDGPDATSGKPYKVALQTGDHVLLFRPREIQDAVNAICGNVGKERLRSERRGETSGGVPVNDPGMLGEEILSKVMGPEQLEEGDVSMNHIPNVSRGSNVEPETLETNS